MLELFVVGTFWFWALVIVEIILLFAFAASWKTAMANLRLSGDPLVQGIGLATLGALTALALQEATDFSLYVPGVAACLAVVIGLNIRASRLPGRRERSATVAPAPPREPTRAVPVLVMRFRK